MTEKDYITLCISAMALIVAVYGIFERGIATRRALRIRLTEIIHDLVKIENDQWVYEQDPSKSEAMKRALREGNASRRALLASQALDILSKYGKRITVPEYTIIASAFRETSDTDSQRAILKQSIDKLETEPVFQQSVAWRVWAWFNFEQNEFDTGRYAVRRSLAVRPAVNDFVRNEQITTLLAWSEHEFRKSPGEYTRWRAILHEADAMARMIDNAEWRLEAIARVAEIGERLRTDALGSEGLTASAEIAQDDA